MFEVFFHARARKFWNRLNSRRQQQIGRIVDRLRSDPASVPNLAPLHGELEGLHRVRVGDYRLVIEIDVQRKVVIVLAIGPRGDICKVRVHPVRQRSRRTLFVNARGPPLRSVAAVSSIHAPSLPFERRRPGGYGGTFYGVLGGGPNQAQVAYSTTSNRVG